MGTAHWGFEFIDIYDWRLCLHSKWWGTWLGEQGATQWQNQTSSQHEHSRLAKIKSWHDEYWYMIGQWYDMIWSIPRIWLWTSAKLFSSNLNFPPTSLTGVSPPTFGAPVECSSPGRSMQTNVKCQSLLSWMSTVSFNTYKLHYFKYFVNWSILCTILRLKKVPFSKFTPPQLGRTKFQTVQFCSWSSKHQHRTSIDFFHTFKWSLNRSTITKYFDPKSVPPPKKKMENYCSKDHLISPSKSAQQKLRAPGQAPWTPWKSGNKPSALPERKKHQIKPIAARIVRPIWSTVSSVVRTIGI